MREGYLVFDIGTGNAKTGIYLSNGKCLISQQSDVQYFAEQRCPDAITFDPSALWKLLLQMAAFCIKSADEVAIKAVLAISSRHGIVLIDDKGYPFMGLPNIDNRGAFLENTIAGEDIVYNIARRRPARYFAAYKLMGLREQSPEVLLRTDKIASLSDWIDYMLTGKLCYEHGQAAETLLYDVSKGCWSEELCRLYGLSIKLLPPLGRSGSLLGTVRPEAARYLGIKTDIPCLIAGADTQIALRGERAGSNELVVVSGTTTPMGVLQCECILDPQQRCWVNPYLNSGLYFVEFNAGVTGLNYQRLRKMFFSDCDYSSMEQPFGKLPLPKVLCSMTTMDFSRGRALPNGAFKLRTPFDTKLIREDFAYALLIDIACSIARNVRDALEITHCQTEEIVGCGGGFNGRVFPQLVADFTRKKVILRGDFSRASSLGGAAVANEYFGVQEEEKISEKVFWPAFTNWQTEIMQQWEELQSKIN